MDVPSNYGTIVFFIHPHTKYAMAKNAPLGLCHLYSKGFPTRETSESNLAATFGLPKMRNSKIAHFKLETGEINDSEVPLF